jgi:hypothetical protein
MVTIILKLINFNLKNIRLHSPYTREALHNTVTTADQRAAYIVPNDCNYGQNV